MAQPTKTNGFVRSEAAKRTAEAADGYKRAGKELEARSADVYADVIDHCVNLDSLDTLLSNGIGPAHFADEYVDVFEFIQDFREEVGEAPSAATLKGNFDYLSIDEPLKTLGDAVFGLKQIAWRRYRNKHLEAIAAETLEDPSKSLTSFRKHAEAIEEFAGTLGTEGKAGWEIQTLGEAMACETEPQPEPTICPTDEGFCLFYEARTHLIMGDSGEGKSLFGLAPLIDVACHQDKRAMVLDWEDVASTIYERAESAYGLNDMQLQKLRDNVLYVNPPGPISDADLGALLARAKECALVLLDAQAGALRDHGLDPNSESDVEWWYNRVPNQLARHGACVITIDHLPKSGKEGFASGSQRKTSGISGLAYDFKIKSDKQRRKFFAPGRVGQAVLSIAVKDRKGRVMQHANSQGQVALFTCGTGGYSIIGLEDEEWQGPANVMEKVWNLIEANPEKSSNWIKANLRMKVHKSTVLDAITLLERDEYIDNLGTKNQSKWVTLKPFKVVPKTGNRSNLELETSDEVVPNTGNQSNPVVERNTAGGSHWFPSVPELDSTGSPIPIPKDGNQGGNQLTNDQDDLSQKSISSTSAQTDPTWRRGHYWIKESAKRAEKIKEEVK